MKVVDGKLHIVLNNNKNAVMDGRLAIERYLASRIYDARVMNRLEVIFEELISNIIRYGFLAQSSQSICVTIAEEPGAIELTFEDDGVPFDPLQAPKPEPSTSIETVKIGGLGISLVRKLSASLSYERLARDDCGPNMFAPCNRTIVRIAT